MELDQRHHIRLLSQYAARYLRYRKPVWINQIVWVIQHAKTEEVRDLALTTYRQIERD